MIFYFIEKDMCKRYYSIEDFNFIPKAKIQSVDASSILLSLQDVTDYGLQIGDLVKSKLSLSLLNLAYFSRMYFVEIQNKRLILLSWYSALSFWIFNKS